MAKKDTQTATWMIDGTCEGQHVVKILNFRREEPNGDNPAADGQTEHQKLAAPVQAGKAVIAFGSRGLPESQVRKHQSWLRESCGRTFNLLVRTLVGLPYKDTQCGFKLFTREAVEAIFPLQTIDGFGFDVEILYIARKLGLRAVEVPVVWNHSEDTRVNLTSGTRAFLDILRVRYLDLHGAYKDRVSSRRGLR